MKAHKPGINQLLSQLTNLRKAYKKLGPASEKKARGFFEARVEQMPHNAWMEARFLNILKAVSEGRVASQVDPESIQPIDPNNSQIFQALADLSPAEKEELIGRGENALKKGEIMSVDLAGGMATGFGGNVAKAVVSAVIDVRLPEVTEISYLDLKFYRYLELQKKYKCHFIAAQMVSAATREDIIKNLQRFAEVQGLELILILPGTGRDRVEKIFQEQNDQWKKSLIVPIIEQPTMLYIDNEGKEVGSEYMKGHGDFADVVQSQLKDIIEVKGIRYIFSSNIDNTGALIDELILGCFTRGVEMFGTTAIMELAEKYEGDKGGAPALIDGVPSVLETAFVPDAWKDAFAGTEVFPYFNTNNFWWEADALLGTPFDLPFMIAKREKKHGMSAGEWLKIETVMAHCLNKMENWKALVIDRGLRFQPDKKLVDLWLKRSDWTDFIGGQLYPRMRSGHWVKKPLAAISESVFKTVTDVNNLLHLGGCQDQMSYLKSLAIGGIGNRFDEMGRLETGCRVELVGDVAIIFGDEPGKDSGKLRIEGKRAQDSLVIKDSLVYVPAGEEVVLNGSWQNRVDRRLAPPMYREFIANLPWTEATRTKLFNKFSRSLPPIDKDLGEHCSKYRSTLDIPTVIEQVKEQISTEALEKLDVLNRVFEVSGSLVLEVKGEKTSPQVRVYQGTKIGLKFEHPADDNWIPYGGTERMHVLPDAGESAKIYVDTAKDHKEIRIPALHYIAIPHNILGNGKKEIAVLYGRFNEAYRNERKVNLFEEKVTNLKILTRHIEIDEASFRQTFEEIPFEDLFELSRGELIKKYFE